MTYRSLKHQVSKNIMMWFSDFPKILQHPCSICDVNHAIWRWTAHTKRQDKCLPAADFLKAHINLNLEEKQDNEPSQSTHWQCCAQRSSACLYRPTHCCLTSILFLSVRDTQGRGFIWLRHSAVQGLWPSEPSLCGRWLSLALQPCF